MTPSVAWASAGAPLPGERVSGDRAVVAEADGVVLVAVIDGLGHGPEAAAAAIAAAAVLEAAPELPLAELVVTCHERLRHTRGVVLSVASFALARGAMTWLGIGNVEGWLVRAHATPQMPDRALVPHAGTVGYLLPTLAPRTVAVADGDTLVFASDGIHGGFRREILGTRSPPEIADAIFAGYAKPSDDSCVLVARYVAGGAGGGA
jgi:hypothetical protein